MVRSGGGVELPRTAEQAARQARGAMRRALQDGHVRQCVSFLLPVGQRKERYDAIDPTDAFEASEQDEFRAAERMAKRMLQGEDPQLSETDEGQPDRSNGIQEDEETNSWEDQGKETVLSRRLDVASSEPVGLLYSKRYKVIACVFPNAETLRELRALDADESRPLVIVNPQWNTSGNIVSDFGVGPWKKRAEEFIQTFHTVYALYEVRVGAPASVDLRVRARGGVVRVLMAYPGKWQVYLMENNGPRCIASMEKKPEYRDLESLLQLYKLSGVSDRLSMQGTMLGNLTIELLDGAGGVPKYTDQEIEGMDKKLLFAALKMYGVPSSGRMSKLRSRLKEVQDDTSPQESRRRKGKEALRSPRKWLTTNGDLYAEPALGDFGAPSLESWEERSLDEEDRWPAESVNEVDGDTPSSLWRPYEKRGAPGISTSTEHRAKISAALKGRRRGDISSEHKHKISIAARKYKEEKGVWGSRKGKLKRCTYCGEAGHNRRSCPKLKGLQEPQAKSSNKRCSVCGEVGHNRRTCPQVLNQQVEQYE